jgi:2-succinyl-5-enolpyruvyl-6-hydroxy-3-cyclohexene-1-carboxylate synthase
MACGIAAESGEPVVITCTGATASRNYYSAMTEAYYRKLPVIAITAHQGNDRIGHLIEQNIDRRRLPEDIAKISVEAVFIENERDEHYCSIEVNKALLECRRHGGGPVHINVFTHYSRDFSVKEIAPVQTIYRYTGYAKLPDMPKGRIAIFVGAHKIFTKGEADALENFCSTYDAVAFVDHTSGYNGKYAVHFALPLSQRFTDFSERNLDLLIHIGETTGDATSRSFNPKQVWRVSEDGEVRDSWGKLTKVFEMPEEFFFKYYAKEGFNKQGYLIECKAITDKLTKEVGDLPLSTIWVAKQISTDIPAGANFQMGIWSSLRAMNYFTNTMNTNGNSNVGGFGIDGPLSTLIGASLCNPKKLYFGIVGDLAFFYDVNVLGNKNVGNNVRIAMINNGRGNEMRYQFSPAASLGEDGNLFLAAAGHNGNSSRSLVKHLAEDLGYEYLSASTKEEFLKQKELFLSPAAMKKPVIFEIFIDDYHDEEKAWEIITSAEQDKNLIRKKNIINGIKAVVGDKGIHIAKKIIGKE